MEHWLMPKVAPKVVGTPENRTAARNRVRTIRPSSNQLKDARECDEESRSFAQKCNSSPLRNEKQANLFCTGKHGESHVENNNIRIPPGC
jgi:hypothetical protein